jgi:hypothetical protein
MGGRTDDQGVLRAHLTKGQTYSFLTAIPNWTTEARHLVKITDEFKDKPLYIAVFHTGQTLEHKGKIPITVRPDTPIINLGYANAKWWPVEVRFSEDNATNRNYLFRLHRFEATLTVTNEPGTYANIMFRAVLSGDSGNPFVYDVRGSQIPPPPQNVKRINLLPADLANIATIRNPVLRIGPMSFESSAGPSCIPWDMQIETGFDNAPRPAPRRSYYYGYGPDAAAIPQPPGAC